MIGNKLDMVDSQLALQRIQNAFLNNISHEVRTPLNAILGCSEVIAMPDTDSETIAELSQQLKKYSNYLLKVIDNIINISKLETGILSLSPNKFDLVFLFSYIYHSSKSLLMVDRAKRENVSYQLVSRLGDAPINVWSDDSFICQIVTALVDNAIKFTERGEVRLTVGLEIDPSNGGDVKDRVLVVDVEDTGTGIASGNLDLIFEKFKKVSPIADKIYDGAGLGLAITKQQLEMLGGSISIESEVGVGSRFSVRIPLVLM